MTNNRGDTDVSWPLILNVGQLMFFTLLLPFTFTSTTYKVYESRRAFFKDEKDT